ncbi:MAG: hypothetical protein K0Q80_283 [Microvirga sp.]|nr:hypothetical protein [Microvirga sp.]
MRPRWNVTRSLLDVGHAAEVCIIVTGQVDGFIAACNARRLVHQ